jgi:hypothetical protein
MNVAITASAVDGVRHEAIGGWDLAAPPALVFFGGGTGCLPDASVGGDSPRDRTAAEQGETGLCGRLDLNRRKDMSATTAELNYIVPTQERPRSFIYEPPDGVPRSNVTTAPHQRAVRDLREEDHAFTLDGEGFAVVEHRSAVTDFQDEAQIRGTYYAEAERLLKDVTGADRVFIFDHTLRHRIPGQEDYRDGPRQPATRVHVDHTVRSGPQRVRDLLPDEAEELLKGRVQVINLWRPINHPVYDAPLAVAEASSVRLEELIPSDLVQRFHEATPIEWRLRSGRGDSEHRWHRGGFMESLY